MWSLLLKSYYLITNKRVNQLAQSYSSLTKVLSSRFENAAALKYLLGEFYHPNGSTRLESGLVEIQCDFRISDGLIHRKKKNYHIICALIILEIRCPRKVVPLTSSPQITYAHAVRHTCTSKNLFQLNSRIQLFMNGHL